MDQSIFAKIHNQRILNQQNKLKSKLDHVKRVREHEFAHARVAGPYVDEIKFFTRKDANNIEHVEHGAVLLNTKLTNSRSTNIEKLSRLIQASEAPENMSQQDKKLRSHLQSQLSRQRQSR